MNASGMVSIQRVKRLLEAMVLLRVLAPGRPLLEDDDASLMIFQSGDKLYIWAVLYYDIYELASQDINEVAHVLSQEGGLKKLQKCLLNPVEDIAV